MLFLRFLALIVMIASGSANAYWYSGSFILNCKNQSDPAHLMPLAFYEFKDEIDLTNLPNDLFKEFLKLAPVTFSTLPRKYNSFRKMKLPPRPIAIGRTDPLLQPPEGCEIEIIAQQEYGNENVLELHHELWDQLPVRVQNYVLLEIAIYQMMKPKLGPIDYRRFPIYVVSGLIGQYTTEQKIYFLKHHGINELGVAGISLDTGRDIVFAEDGSGEIKDAHAFPGAMFEGAKIDPARFVSFDKNGKLSALATVTPFKRKIRGQEFSFFIPADALAAWPFDNRYAPRTAFHPNGTIAASFTVPFNYFYSLVTDIRNPIFNKRDYYEVKFFEDGAPKEVAVSKGAMKFQNKSYSVVRSRWRQNGSIEELSFNGRADVMFKGKIVDALGVSCDEKGEVTGVH